MSAPIKLHLLYEYGQDLRPHGSAFIRLLRPFSHPGLAAQFQVSSGLNYEGQPVDAVIVDRLWHPLDITLASAQELVNQIRRAGARFIYTVDDNFFDIPASHRNKPSATQLAVVAFFLEQADAVWVTTTYLQERLRAYNSHILVLPNCLDERILIQRYPENQASSISKPKRIIGYMGTMTHDDDLIMILPALQMICDQHPEVEIQIIGVTGHAETRRALANLPVRFLNVPAGENEYPLFMLWFTSWVRWDLALAPLQENVFSNSKSDIKFLDYAALATPAIFSAVPAYQNSVQHRRNGWLVPNQVEDWVTAMDTLLQDASLRLGLAENAAGYLYAQRVLAQSYPNWIAALQASLVR